MGVGSLVKDFEDVRFVPFDWKAIGRRNWRNLTSKVFCNEWEVYRLCFSLKLIPKKRACDQCGENCSLYQKRKTSSGRLSLTFGCPKCRPLGNRVHVSVRTNTLFGDTKLPMWQVLGLFYWFVRGHTNAQDLIHECSVEGSELATHTVIHWFNFCREVCHKKMNQAAIGGVGRNVEISEFAFARPKSNQKKRPACSAAVVCGVCRETESAFAFVNSEQTSEEFLSLVTSHVQPETNIITDCWRSYPKLSKQEWKHTISNHNLNFVDGDEPSETHNVKSLWAHLRKTVPSSIQPNLLDLYLGAYVWRRNFSKLESDLYELFLQHVAETYHTNS